MTGEHQVLKGLFVIGINFGPDGALALAGPSRSNSGGMALVVDNAINEIAAAAPSRGTTGEIFRSLAADPDGRAEFAGALAA